jgi:serine/threonine protein kinase
MAENLNSPVFADRYRFQTVGADWDRGRSGFTHLVFDIKKERLGVIKRAEIKSQKAVEGLKNEVAALLDLKGSDVPEVYDTGETEYGSKDYFYMVVEYIEGMRVEKNLDLLTAPERAEILTQFFGILARSHQMGIVNGDVDLKHLFWHKDKKQLVVIDWGNAKLGIDPKNKTEFAYDLARSAEIIYSLVTRKGHPSATGSIALPNDSSLIPGLAPLPTEFRDLCKWAPRTPNAGANSPHTAQELFDVSNTWQKAVKGAKPFQPKRRSNWGLLLLFGIIIIGAIFLGISPISPLHSLIYPNTPIPPTEVSNTPIPITDTASPTETPSATLTSTEVPTVTQSPTPSPTFTSTVAITPTARSYVDSTPVMVFEENTSSTDCWTYDTNLPNGVSEEFKEGFNQRNSDKNWGFKIIQERTIDQFIRTDFNPCLAEKQVNAVAMDVWVEKLELQRIPFGSPEKIEPGKEFGIFVENEKGDRREYTIWMDIQKSMHLRVRDNNNILLDNILPFKKDLLKIEQNTQFPYSKFPIQFFLEINNNNLDIIYWKEGSQFLPLGIKELDPKNMNITDWAVLPTLGTIKKTGLIGYGGNIQTVIWLLAFFGK